jgi:hypothetical protein
MNLCIYCCAVCLHQVQLPDAEALLAVSRLGWLNVFNPFRPSGRYQLNLTHTDERQVSDYHY